MAEFLKNFGLEFLAEEEKTFMGMVGMAVQEGVAIKGYYGLPYLNKHFGDVQIVVRADWKDGKENMQVVGVDTHCAGPCVWTVRNTGINLTPEDAHKTQRRIVAGKPHANSGLAPINLINADVLPGYRTNDIIKLQMIAFPVLLDYFADEAAYEDSVTSEFEGGKLLVREGHVFPSGFLKNRNPNSEEFEKNNWMDDHVLLRGTVKKLCRGQVTLGEETFDSYIICIIDTEFGELEIIHTLEQVKAEQRENLRVGAMLSGIFVLSGDPAIYEYENGIVLDTEHNLRLMQSVFEGDDPERMRGVLAENATYVAEYNDKLYTGVEEIIARMRYVKDSGRQFFASLATVTGGEEGLPYGVGTRCVAIAHDSEERYQTLAFADMDEAGRIARIFTTDSSRYAFTLDAKWQPTETDDDL